MRRARALVLTLALLAAGPPAAAQTVVASAGPDAVEVTIYRDPDRPADEPMDLEWLEGFALISERRQVTLPAGESQLRFEGVAGGILPQSAIVTGLPEAIVERNRDAYLLSPGTLLDRSLGRRVHLRRTSLATGAVREQAAEIRSGADGAVVLRTEEGFESLRCTGLAETLGYDEVPADLAARPTLSVRVRNAQPVTATVTLSYIADGFDWQADYIATLSADGQRIDLLAWLTLANGDETGFANAGAQAVAGWPNREDDQPEPAEARALTLRCWPQATTSDIPLEELRLQSLPQYAAARGEELVVTGSRIRQANLTANAPVTVIQAQPEDLGDLKLYRIPEPVTVAANSQKQVALLRREAVEVAFVYRTLLWPTQTRPAMPLERYLVTRNRTAEGLGLALPAGNLMLFAERGGRPVLIAQGRMEDRAVGEDVEIPLGSAPGVRSAIERVRDGESWDEYVLTATNDRSEPVRFEAEFLERPEFEFRPRQRLGRRDGRPLWAVTVPANGAATLRYRVVERDD